MIASAKTRYGLIGAGAIAQAYAQAFQDCEFAQLAAIADVRLEAAEAIAELHHCPAFSDYKQICERTDIDAVIVCTPPATHPEICIHAANKGVHVLCEKPLAIHPEDARRMINAAMESGVKLTMASKFRYVNDVIRAKAIVTSGILGEIVLFENSFTAHVDMSTRWNSNPAVSGGGVLIDNGTHSLDIMRYFLGPLGEIQVIEGKRIQHLPVEDTVRVFVKSLSGVMGSIDLSWSINKEQAHFINIFGSNGTIRVGWKSSQYRRHSDDEWITFGNGYSKVQAFRSQIENFTKAIRGEEALLINHDDALASVEVIEAAYQALRESHWIPVGNKHLQHA